MCLTGNWHAQWPELWKVFGYLRGRGGRREGKNKIVFLIRVIKIKKISIFIVFSPFQVI